jgi:SAM-dependent methyltransferase
MTESHTNVYDDDTRARAYSEMEFPGTYYLAFRDIPDILVRHAHRKAALDFGCGAGRSTRFLKDQGYHVLGVDISEAMLRQARERDPEGDYLLVSAGDLSSIESRRFDVVLCAFTFDNIPSPLMRIQIFRQLRDLLAADGRIINLVSAPEIYLHEWASFSTQAFPENREAGSGELVRIIMLDVDDRRPIEDLLWTNEDYCFTFEEAELELLETHRPLGRPGEPFRWVSEETVSPWAVHVLRAQQSGR